MNLEKNEFMLVVDSTNGFALWDEESDPVKKQGLGVKDQIFFNVEESIRIDKLDEKWGVNPGDLLEKMEKADEDEYKQLWKQIEEFWVKNDQSNREKL